MARQKRGGGELIESVAFDELSLIADGYGNQVQDFVERFRTRAGFTWLRGGETVQAARLEGVQPAVVQIRACQDAEQIRPDWRMRDLRSGTVYAIRGITRSDSRGYFDVLVQSGVAA